MLADAPVKTRHAGCSSGKGVEMLSRHIPSSTQQPHAATTIGVRSTIDLAGVWEF